MPEIKIGEVKVYHESGALFRVRVLEIHNKEYGNTPGEEYRLKLLDTKNCPANPTCFNL